MKRSSAPSVVWKKKKEADGTSICVDENGRPLAAANGEKINHLDWFTEKVMAAAEEEAPEERGRRTRVEVHITKKNFVLNSPASTPLCFAVVFTNNNREAKKNVSGDGMCSLFPHPCFILPIETTPQIDFCGLARI